ncbi:MAG: TonB family protein [Verrucomicrobiota bacterium]
MSSLVYAINITTLALWLGLACLDGVAWLLPVWHVPAKSSRAGETAAFISNPEISLGAPEVTAAVSDPAREVADIPPPDALPEPPQIPQTADLPPLPEVPDISEVSLPAMPSVPTAPRQPAATPPQQRSSKSAARTRETASGETRAGAIAARMAAGKMPPPIYPAQARSKGQSGSVLIEFTVGIDGRVLSAYAKEPSRWPLLDNEALDTVRRWTFPPGTVMKLQRQIDFKLK